MVERKMNAGIACPHCGSLNNEIHDSRKEAGYVLRTRVCISCETPFKTWELSAYPSDGFKKARHLYTTLSGVLQSAKVAEQEVRKIMQTLVDTANREGCMGRYGAGIHQKR